MSVVASVDYPNNRILLSAGAFVGDFDALDAYREVVALRKANAADRQYPPIIQAGGNLTKVTGVSYTLPYVQLASGTRFTPFDSTGRITLIRDLFAADGVAGVDCFDRSGLTLGVMVDIDVNIQEVEVRVETVGGVNTITGDITSPTTLAALAAAVLAAAATTPIASNIKKVNGGTITGTGVPPTFDADGVMTDPGDPWAPV